MKCRSAFVFLLLLISFSSYSQKGMLTVSGYVKEAATGESLLGANVYIKETMKGTVTNQYGFYSITVPSGEYTLAVSYLGFNFRNKGNL